MMKTAELVLLFKVSLCVLFSVEAKKAPALRCYNCIWVEKATPSLKYHHLGFTRDCVDKPTNVSNVTQLNVGMETINCKACAKQVANRAPKYGKIVMRSCLQHDQKTQCRRDVVKQIALIPNKLEEIRFTEVCTCRYDLCNSGELPRASMATAVMVTTLGMVLPLGALQLRGYLTFWHGTR